MHAIGHGGRVIIITRLVFVEVVAQMQNKIEIPLIHLCQRGVNGKMPVWQVGTGNRGKPGPPYPLLRRRESTGSPNRRHIRAAAEGIVIPGVACQTRSVYLYTETRA